MVDYIDISGTPVNNVRPLAAVRLINFDTGDATLKPDHIYWINRKLPAALIESPGPWVDIVAFASRRGDGHYDNQRLSEARRAATRTAVLRSAPGCNLCMQAALGSTRSSGPANNDDPYWRAVEIHVFGFLPPQFVPVRTQDPLHGSGQGQSASPWWLVTNLALNGSAYVDDVGGGSFRGRISFAHPHDFDHAVNRSIWIAGIAAGASLGIPARAATTIMQRLVSTFLNNSSFSFGPLWSSTIGVCLPNPRLLRMPVAEDFSGECVTSFLSANATVFAGACYILLYGLPHGFANTAMGIAEVAGSVAPELGIIAYFETLLARCKGVAVLHSFGLGLSWSLGATGNLMVGAIG